MNIQFWTSFNECEDLVRPFLEKQSQSPFLNFDWLQTHWKHFGDSSKMKLLLTGVFEGEELITLAPLYAKKRLLGVWEVKIIGDGKSDYLGFAGEVTAEILNAIVKEVSDQWPNALFKFNDISDTNPLSKILDEQTFLSRAEKIELFSCPYWDMITASKKKASSSRKKFQSRIRGSLRKMQSLGNFECVVLDFDKDRESALGMFERLFALHKLRHYGTLNGWLKDANRNFLQDFIRSSAKSQVIAFVSSLDGNPLVFELGFREGNRFILYIPAFHPAFSKFRLGHVNRYLAFQHCEKMGIEVYDFSKGDRPDKRFWANEIKSNYLHLFVYKTTPANILMLLKDSFLVRAKVWSREKGFNHRIRQTIGSVLKSIERKKPENVNKPALQETESNGDQKTFQFNQILDLPLNDQISVMDFIFQHGGKGGVKCQRFPNYLHLSGGEPQTELKVTLSAN